MKSLSKEQTRFYRENGYLVLPSHLGTDIVDGARAEIDRLSQHARTIVQSDDKIDLEESHTIEQPRIRRIKRPDLQSNFFADLSRHPKILGPVCDLIGPNVRLHTAKLNMKKAEYGAPVHWHQDWAFYPHTNDDVLAVGIVFDDMDDQNGPLQVIPGTHLGPILDHHHNGFFSGSVDLEASQFSSADAVPLKGPAGTVSIHHARILHGSSMNRSSRDRRMLFYEVMAADAFPLMGAMTQFTSIEEYDSRMLCGESTKEPRIEPVPVRLPVPLPPRAGSIYEVQSQGKSKAINA